MRRILGAGVAAAALVGLLAGTAQADGPVIVSVIGPPSGVAAYCPDGMRPGTWTITNPDGSPIDPGQRVRWTVTSGEHGIGAWIAPYDQSPPPPPAIELTVVCVC